MRQIPYTIKRLAEHWVCSQSHVLQLINRGDLRVVAVGPSRIRIPRQEVDRFETVQLGKQRDFRLEV